ncbi:Protein outspread, partial [Orchesella cincta]
REAEYTESLKCKDEIIEELRDQLTREISVREKLELQTHELEQQVQLLSEKVAKVQSLLSETERELDQSNINQRELGRITESQQMQLKQELDLLRVRCNDLTEKLYQSEKTAKTLKTKLGRVKSQSLKDRQIESDVICKIHDLEEKISRFDKSPLSPSSTTSGASLSLPPSASLPTSPTESTPGAVTSPGGGNTPGGRDGGIINVIMKLNDLDQRVEKVTESLWFRRGELEDYVGECQNCKILEMEVRERDERLEVLEGNLKKLELEFDKKMQELREFVKEQPPSSQEASPSYHQATNKYQVEIEQLRNLCAKGLEAMENSHRRMIMELEEKHRRELQNLRIEKEQELAEETKATLSALDAMRKNHQLELQREMAKFKEEFMRKFQCNQDLSDLHREHEEELYEVKTEILRLTEKYSLKCVEASKLEETITYLKSQLNEAKRKMIEMEASDFQSCISSVSKVDPSTRPQPKPRTSRQQLQPVEQALPPPPPLQPQQVVPLAAALSPQEIKDQGIP